MDLNVELPPVKNSDYSKKDYWNKRFDTEDHYEWLTRYDQIENSLKTLIDKENKILIVGCGNSNFSCDLYDAGYQNIVNLDFSDVVIKKQKGKYQFMRPKMTWIVGDMLYLSSLFSKESFDIVIDKAAMDAITTNEGDVWNPNPSIINIINKIFNGIKYILKKNGKFIQISFAQPHFRKKYLLGPDNKINNNYSETYGWTFSYENIDVGLGYFFYKMILQDKP